MREARQYAGGGAWLGNALGQTVSVDLRRGVVSGRISRIDSAVVDGTVTVEAKLEGICRRLRVQERRWMGRFRSLC
jgi:hypothetical protein